MSGHSKWANIKRKKEANDKVKGSVFGKLARMITLAVIEGGGMPDPDNNVRLRLAIEKAKQENLPKDNIQRAIEKGTGAGRDAMKEVVYEAFGPSGTALVILGATDNPNRTLGELRGTLERHGGKLGNQGSVMYLFQRCGAAAFPKAGNSEEAIFSFSDRIQALDIDESDDMFTVYFPYDMLGKAGEARGTLVGGAPELDYKPLSTVAINTPEESKKIITLVESVEALDDVQKVFANFVIPEDHLS